MRMILLLSIITACINIASSQPIGKWMYKDSLKQYQTELIIDEEKAILLRYLDFENFMQYNYSEMHGKWKRSSAIRVQASLILKIIICLTLRRVSY